MAATKYLDYDGLLYFWQKLKTKFPSENTTYTLTQDATDGHKITLTPSSGSATTITIPDNNTEYTGSSPISVNASTHVISHDASGVTAGDKGDMGSAGRTPGFGGTFKVTSGTVDATGHLTLFQEHTVTIPNATASTTAAGLMSSSDKTKLNGIETGAEENVIEIVKANNVTLTVTDKTVNIPLMVTGDGGGEVTPRAGLVPGATYNERNKFFRGDGTWQDVPTVVDSALSTTSENAVQNKVITNALSAKAPTASPTFTGTVTIPTAASGTSDTTAASTAFVMAAVAAGGVTVDSALSTSSENPVQNKVITNAVNAKAPLASPALTGTPTAPTATAGTNTTQIATTAFVTNAISTAQVGAATFQGTVNANTDISNLTDYKKGWYWVVATAGTYVGQACEVGDMIFAVEDRDGAYSASDFSVLQTNLDIVPITNAEIDTILAS